MAFNGFSNELRDFLSQLAANNTRSWFEAHRSTYDEHYIGAAKTFVEAMQEPLRAVDPDARGEARINGSIRRINRDVRFSKDKSPYTPALQLVFWRGDSAKGSPGYHFYLTAEKLGIGCGQFGWTPPQLEAYRERIAHTDDGTVLHEAIARASSAGYRLAEPHLKREPKGYNAADEHAYLLRYKGIHFGKDRPIPDEWFDRRATEYAASRIAELEPVVRWLSGIVPG